MNEKLQILRETPDKIYKNYELALETFGGVTEYKDAELAKIQFENIELVNLYITTILSEDELIKMLKYGELDSVIRFGLFSLELFNSFTDLGLLIKLMEYDGNLSEKISKPIKELLERKNEVVPQNDSDFLFSIDLLNLFLGSYLALLSDDVTFDVFMTAIKSQIKNHGARWRFVYILLAYTSKVADKYPDEIKDIDEDYIFPILSVIGENIIDNSHFLDEQGVFNFIDIYMSLYGRSKSYETTSELFHYTNKNALELILSGSSIKMGVPETMNDLKEGKYGFSSSEKKINTASFGIYGDSNALWGNYTNFDGVCLEFDRESLTSQISMLISKPSAHHTRFFRADYSMMYYGSAEVDYFIDKYSKLEKTMRKIFKAYAAELDAGIKHFKNLYAWFFKMEPWRYEGELRVMIQSHLLKQIMDAGIDGINYSILSKDNILIKFNKKSLKKIRLAPYLKSSSIYREGLRNFLDNNGYSHVEITSAEADIQKL